MLKTYIRHFPSCKSCSILLWFWQKAKRTKNSKKLRSLNPLRGCYTVRAALYQTRHRCLPQKTPYKQHLKVTVTQPNKRKKIDGSFTTLPPQNALRAFAEHKSGINQLARIRTSMQYSFCMILRHHLRLHFSVTVDTRC